MTRLLVGLVIASFVAIALVALLASTPRADFSGSGHELGELTAIYVSCMDHFSEDAIVKASVELQTIAGMPLASDEWILVKNGAMNFWTDSCAAYDCKDIAVQANLCAVVMAFDGKFF